MFGVIPDSEFAAGAPGDVIARELHKQINQSSWEAFPSAGDTRFRVRMIVFAPETAKHSQERKFISLQHALDFIFTRMRPAAVCSPYRGSNYPVWKGMTGEIVRVLDEAYVSGKASITTEELISALLPSPVNPQDLPTAALR